RESSRSARLDARHKRHPTHSFTQPSTRRPRRASQLERRPSPPLGGEGSFRRYPSPQRGEGRVRGELQSRGGSMPTTESPFSISISHIQATHCQPTAPKPTRPHL